MRSLIQLGSRSFVWRQAHGRQEGQKIEGNQEQTKNAAKETVMPWNPGHFSPPSEDQPMRRWHAVMAFVFRPGAILSLWSISAHMTGALTFPAFYAAQAKSAGQA